MNDFNEIIQSNIQETDLKCLSCGGEASLKYMKIEDVKPEVVVSVFECKFCFIKETKFFNQNEDVKNAIQIVCNFNSKDDLKRQINLNKNTVLKIEYKDLEYKDLEYSFESSEFNIYTVEGIILQAITNLNGDQGFSTINDIDKLKRAIGQLQEILTNPTFRLTIEDKVGLSRVGPIGVDLYKIQDKELSYFDDEKVTHKKLEMSAVER